DFHRDIRGTTIRFSNPSPTLDIDQAKSYLRSFDIHQTGQVGTSPQGFRLLTIVSYPYTDSIPRRMSRFHPLLKRLTLLLSVLRWTRSGPGRALKQRLWAGVCFSASGPLGRTAARGEPGRLTPHRHCRSRWGP